MIVKLLKSELFANTVFFMRVRVSSYTVVVELNETPLCFVSNLVSFGNVKTTILKAFTLEELEKMLSGKSS